VGKGNNENDAKSLIGGGCPMMENGEWREKENTISYLVYLEVSYLILRIFFRLRGGVHRWIVRLVGEGRRGDERREEERMRE